MATSTTSATPDTGQVARAGIRLNLTAAGWAVVAMMGTAIFLGSASRLAVGFFIPLAALLMIDVFLSWHVVSRRTVSLIPSRTVAHLPDPIPLRVRVDGPAHPVVVKVALPGGVDGTVGVSNRTEQLELFATQTFSTDYLRCQITSTVLGLGSARRWETHRLPTLHWAPAPATTRVTTPNAQDEIARLRTYVPGDRMSRVSWPITARTGQMHVRTMGDGQEEFTLVLNLGAAIGSSGEGALVTSALPPGALEPHANIVEGTLKLASTLISQLLDDGHQVRLITTELAPDARNILRSAAAANPRAQASVPETTPVALQAVDRPVTDDDDAARRLALAKPGPTATWGYGPYIDVSMLGIRTLP